MARKPENWVTVAARSTRESGSAIGVTVGDLDSAIYVVGGQLYATDNCMAPDLP